MIGEKASSEVANTTITMYAQLMATQSDALNGAERVAEVDVKKFDVKLNTPESRNCPDTLLRTEG